MLFAGREVRIEIWPRSLCKTRAQFFSIRTSRPSNDVYILLHLYFRLQALNITIKYFCFLIEIKIQKQGVSIDLKSDDIVCGCNC